MAQRRKSLSEKEIRTLVAVWESVQERNHYNWQEMNCFIGSITLDEMYQLGWRLKDWLNGEEKEVEDDYR